jgi:sortase A
MAIVLAVALVLFVGTAVIVQVRRLRRPDQARPTGARPVAPVPPPAAGRDPMSRLVGVLRRNRWARVSLSVASVAMLLGAVGVLGYPFYTNLVQSRIQSRLDRQLASPELKQAYLDRRVDVGDSLTRIKIPSINVDVVVVEGTTASALRAGAGHYPDTPLPCEAGNVAIAGHRTTYGRPFHNLDLVKPGDAVILETPIGQCTYEVAGAPFVVSPTNLSVLNQTPDATLTLTTCHPKGSARERLVLHAKMVSSQPARA